MSECYDSKGCLGDCFVCGKSHDHDFKKSKIKEFFKKFLKEVWDFIVRWICYTTSMCIAFNSLAYVYGFKTENLNDLIKLENQDIVCLVLFLFISLIFGIKFGNMVNCETLKLDIKESDLEALKFKSKKKEDK
jgi:hypothetical protein